MELAKEVHLVSERLPARELYRLTTQLGRAVVSVPANIAEGYGRATPRDFANFLSIAQGSLMETETLLRLAVSFDYLAEDQIARALSLSGEVRRMLASLRKKVNLRNQAGH